MGRFLGILNRVVNTDGESGSTKGEGGDFKLNGKRRRIIADPKDGKWILN